MLHSVTYIFRIRTKKKINKQNFLIAEERKRARGLILLQSTAGTLCLLYATGKLGVCNKNMFRMNQIKRCGITQVLLEFAIG